MAPLLLDDGAGDYVSLHVGVPIGVQPRGDYREQTVPLPADATLIAFTDGLVERRGEVLDVGLGRLRDLATAEHFTLDDLLAKLAEGLAEEDRDDDTAIVGISWQT
jgi:serine phosphatase RsbU (regulator of sigma subunit)